MLQTSVIPLVTDHQVLHDHVSLPTRYLPEENPFETIFVDLTHRCNMRCRNCYIPNRDVPDLNKEWLFDILRRLPRRTRIRLVGAEPTMRADLPEIISRVRELRHWPMVLTNGLKLAHPDYVAELKRSGLHICYLSFNGGFHDEYYELIDDLACARKKRQALENLVAAHLYISLGMIIVPGINESAIGEVFRYALEHSPIREIHIRSVGALGRYLPGRAYSLQELVELFQEQTGGYLEPENACQVDASEYVCQYRRGRLKVQMTQWPDLGSRVRGRLALDGTIQPAFEHMMANEGGY
ncbi:MAG: radical SAM protein [Armatimonadota bacterium]|nr:radical SAM protein [Armatimonadota bacterium]